MAPESLKHRIWIEVAFGKSMPAPDEAYDVQCFFRATIELAALTNQRWNALDENAGAKIPQ